MQYIESNNILIYPTSTRSVDIDPAANLNIESNLVETNLNILDNNSYIVSGLKVTAGVEGNSITVNIEAGNCVINGYSIELKEDLEELSDFTYDTSYNSLTGSANNYLYLELKLEQDLTSGYYQVNGVDDGGKYKGLVLDMTSHLDDLSDKAYVILAKISGDTQENLVIDQQPYFAKLNSGDLSDVSKPSALAFNYSLSNLVSDGFEDQYYEQPNTVQQLFSENHFVLDDGDFSQNFNDYDATANKLIIVYDNGLILSLDLSISESNNNSFQLTKAYLPDAENISKLCIPNYVKSIATGALSNLTSLQYLYLPSTITTVPDLNASSNLAIIEYGNSSSIFISNNTKRSSQITGNYSYDPDTQALTNHLFNVKCTDKVLKNISYIEVATTTLATLWYLTYDNMTLSNLDDKSIVMQVNIPENITSISANMFANCSNLSSIRMSTNLESLGEYAFKACTSLTSITLPENVTVINHYALQGCTSLSNLYIENLDTLLLGYDYDYCGSLLGHNFRLYLNQEELTDLNITNGTYSYIPYRAFSRCLSLQKVNLDNLDIVKAYAFEYCANIYQVTLGRNLRELTNRVFSDCLGISSIYYNCENLTIGDNVSGIFFYAGANSVDGITLVIGDYVEAIPQNLFYVSDNSSSYNTYYPRIVSIEWPSNNAITTIGRLAFSYLKDLECDDYTLSLPEGVERVEANAFKRSLTHVNILNIPASVEYIGVSAFSGSGSTSYDLETVNIASNSNLTTIDIGAFNENRKLSKFNLPVVNNAVDVPLTTINRLAFQNCKITSLIIPSSVTYIGYQAFRYNTTINFYYEGTSIPDTWDSGWNYGVTNRPIYYYSDSPNYDGQHWHYVDNKPVIYQNVTLTSLSSQSSGSYSLGGSNPTPSFDYILEDNGWSVYNINSIGFTGAYSKNSSSATTAINQILSPTPSNKYESTIETSDYILTLKQGYKVVETTSTIPSQTITYIYETLEEAEAKALQIAQGSGGLVIIGQGSPAVQPQTPDFVHQISFSLKDYNNTSWSYAIDLSGQFEGMQDRPITNSSGSSSGSFTPVPLN